jgi:N-methylhydantoinase B
MKAVPEAIPARPAEAAARPAHDPVTLALVQNRLDYIAQQMGWVMTRTARSPIFNQSHDFSCFVADAAGRLVSQADGIPIHTGGGGFAVRALLGAFGDDLRDGDVFLQNDPYAAGGNHLPDWVIARPVFVEGRLVAFTCNRAHQSDIGGGAAGTYNPEATEIFHEGIRLPPLRLVEQGRTREDLWQLLMLNTRTPHYLDGDLRAMMGSTRIGADQVAQLMAQMGIDEGLKYFDGILDHADRRLRAAVAALPDGVYEGKEWLDDDCFEPMDIPIRVSLTVRGDALTVDFTGTGAQIRGFKNSSLANTHSSVYTALTSFFDPDIPRNEGTFRCVTIVAPEGSLVNARAPAPLTMCTVFPAHQIIQACWKALAPADPARSCAGWGTVVYPNTSGLDRRAQTFVMYNWGGNSGAGAVKGRDGFNQIGPMITLGGLVVPNAETYEQLYPIRVLKQEFRRDAAGAGEFRGGTGVEYAVDVQVPAEYSFRSEGLRRPSGFGTNGGRPGAIGRVGIAPDGGAPETPPTYGLRRLGPARLSITSNAGGGWGDPLDRDPERVLRDVRDGIVSPEAAYEAYGVVLAPDRDGLDLAATEARRRARAGGRG